MKSTTETIEKTLARDPSYLFSFSIVVVAQPLPLSLIDTIDTSCRVRNIPFVYTAARGALSWIFLDLGDAFTVDEPDIRDEFSVDILEVEPSVRLLPPATILSFLLIFEN